MHVRGHHPTVVLLALALAAAVAVAAILLVVAGYMKQVQKHLPILVWVGHMAIVSVNAVKALNALIM